ncbi:hypothetical protein EI94DRAFT_1704260 [Lactarius quietus]|nr:hypothetical protein EI94DRAFT_1704260 [Lactarius quietus]
MRPSVYELTDLYHDTNGAEIMFTAGEDTREASAAERHNKLLADAEYFAPLATLGGTTGWKVTLLRIVITHISHPHFTLGLENTEGAPDTTLRAFQSLSEDQDWSPYPNKTMYLLDMLDNLPRLRMSNKHLEAILFVMRESGARDVPSLDTLRRLQSKLSDSFNCKPTHHVSADGNIYYINDIVAQIAEDFANPLVRPHLMFYPEDLQGKVCEAWQAQKWLAEAGLDNLSPMVVFRDQHFYVNELAECVDGSYVIPVRWVMRNSVLCGDVCQVVCGDDGLFSADLEKIYSFPITHFKHSFPHVVSNLGEDGILFKENQRALRTAMPHPIRMVAKGRPFYRVGSSYGVMMYLAIAPSSGTSTGIGTLHMQVFQRDYYTKNTLYICLNISTCKYSLASIWDLQANKKEEILFTIGIFTLPADNPMQSELASHIGLKVGGTQQQKNTEEGFHALFSPGIPRSVVATRNEVTLQIHEALQGQDIEERQRMTGVKDAITQKFIDKATSQRLMLLEHHPDIPPEELDDQMAAWLAQQTEQMNPLLTMNGLDPNLDTPVEPLHTVLLGTINSKALDIFQARLGSINVQGLNCPPIRASYLIQYRGSLIGRQFKQIVQVVPFAIHGLVDEDLFTVWLAAGKVAAMIWFPEIDNVTEYCHLKDDLRQHIDNFLDAVAIVDPEHIKAKPKFHILTHTPEDIRRFGPAVTSSTEIFECYNAIFRFCSILSNHQAPSRDIAQSFCSLGRFKHVASGGWWKDGDGQWTRAVRSKSISDG